MAERPRALCLHGLGGTAATVEPLAERLRAGGFDVEAPTLAGHGTEPTDLRDVSWGDWTAAATGQRWALIAGQSMGADLALAAAAEGCATTVIAINPLAPDPDAVDGLEWRHDRGQGWFGSPALAPGEVGYPRLPIEALLTMAAGVATLELARITVPVLIVTSADDEVVDPANSDLVASGLGGPVERLVLATGSHVATLGPQAGELLDAAARFAGRYAK